MREAAKEASKGAGADLLLVCGFAFDANAGEIAQEFQPIDGSGWAVAAGERKLGKLQVLLARMNPDLAMGDELLKKTGAGNLFMVFGEPDVEIRRPEDGHRSGRDPRRRRLRPDHGPGPLEHRPTTSPAGSSTPNYNGESFFVRHAYFTGADDPYDTAPQSPARRHRRGGLGDALHDGEPPVPGRPRPARSR